VSAPTLPVPALEMTKLAGTQSDPKGRDLARLPWCNRETAPLTIRRRITSWRGVPVLTSRYAWTACPTVASSGTCQLTCSPAAVLHVGQGWVCSAAGRRGLVLLWGAAAADFLAAAAGKLDEATVPATASIPAIRAGAITPVRPVRRIEALMRTHHLTTNQPATQTLAGPRAPARPKINAVYVSRQAVVAAVISQAAQGSDDQP